jgi:hypothetical protein
MKKILCLFFFLVNPVMSMEYDKDTEQPFVPIEDKSIILDINDPEVQGVIKKIVSISIRDVLDNKELEYELQRANTCCNSNNKVKLALITAATTSITGIVTIILNLK